MNKECNLCQDQGFTCKEYPFKTRVMRFRRLLDIDLGEEDITQLFLRSPITSCHIRPAILEYKKKIEEFCPYKIDVKRDIN